MLGAEEQTHLAGDHLAQPETPCTRHKSQPVSFYTSEGRQRPRHPACTAEVEPDTEQSLHARFYRSLQRSIGSQHPRVGEIARLRAQLHGERLARERKFRAPGTLDPLRGAFHRICLVSADAPGPIPAASRAARRTRPLPRWPPAAGTPPRPPRSKVALASNSRSTGKATSQKLRRASSNVSSTAGSLRPAWDKLTNSSVVSIR